ncbi:MAG: hypothetical protein ACX93O_16495 [Flagellimonas sp.]
MMNGFGTKTNTTRQLNQIKGGLLQVVTKFFNQENQPFVIYPEECSIHLGIYRNANPPRSLLKDKGRAQQLGAIMQHVLVFDDKKLRVSGEYPNNQFHANHVWKNQNNLRNAFFDRVIQRADLVYDKYEALRHAGIVGAEAISKSSLFIRNRNFERSFEDILPPTTVRHEHIEAFYGSLANGGTYDKDGKYYHKYLDPSPSEDTLQSFDPNRLTDDYIRKNLFEVIPVKNEPHVLFRKKSHWIVYQLKLDSQNKVSWELLFSKGFSPGDDLLHVMNPLDSPTPIEAIFFFTASGSSTMKPVEQEVYKFDGIFKEERYFDPAVWVKEELEMKEDDPDAFDDEWDWFVAMMEIRFGNRIYEVRASAAMSQFLNRKTLVFDPLKEASRKAKGEYKKRMTEALQMAQKDPDLNFFIQGMPLERTGKRLFIGTDSQYAYIRRTEIGLTSRIPINLFLQDLKITNIAGEVYDRTKHLIPIIAVFMILATGGAVGGVIGFGVLWMGFKYLVKDQIINQISKPAVKKVLARFKYQIRVLMVDSIISLFPRTNMKYLEFTRGFLRGFSRDAIESLLKQYGTTLARGPSLYRWYRMFSRLEAALNTLKEKIDRLMSIVDKAASKLILDRFVRIGTKVRTAFILLTSNVHFLDYDAVDPYLEVYSELAGTKKPSRNLWERDRALRMVQLFDGYADEISQATDKAIKQGKELNASILSGTIKAVSVTKDLSTVLKLSGHFGMIATIAGVGGLTVGVGLDFWKNEGGATKLLGKLLLKGPQALLQGKYSSKQVGQLGQIIGHVAGGFFLNGAIFAKGTKLGKVKELGKKKTGSKLINARNKMFSSFVTGELGLGHGRPIIQLVFSHYIILLERLVELKDEFLEETEEKISKLLYGTESYVEFQATARQPISFQKAKNLTLLIDDILMAQLDRLMEEPGLDQELKRAANYLKRAKAPTWEDLIEGKIPKEFSRRAITFAAVMHLQNALSEIADMLDLILSPVETARGDDVSIEELLSILGLTTTEEEAFRVKSEELKSTFSGP